jgi:GGDEF domain-containing protein
VLGGRSIVVGGSIGIALATGRGVTTAEDLITQADAAMYAAKRSGKGTFAIYEPAMPTRTWTELEAAG